MSEVLNIELCRVFEFTSRDYENVCVSKLNVNPLPAGRNDHLAVR